MLPKTNSLGFVAAIHVAIQLLGIACAGEQGCARGAADAGANEQEFGIAAEIAQLRGNPNDSMNLLAIGFRPHALVGRRASLVDHLRHVGNLAADDAAERGTDAAEQTHGLDAVADHHAARDQSLEAHAVDFISRQTGQFRRVEHVSILGHCRLGVDARRPG